MESEAAIPTIEPAPKKKRRGLRLGVSHLVLITSVIGLGIISATSLAKLRIASIELRKLHRELGHLVVDDPEEIHLIAVPNLENWTWQWRVHFPIGRAYRIRLATREISPKNNEWPESDLLSMQLEGSGEVLVELGMRRNLEGELEAVIALPTQSTRKPSEEFAWIDEQSGAASMQKGGDGIVVLDADATFDLLRYQTLGPTGVSVNPTTGTSNGLLLWVEEVESK